MLVRQRTLGDTAAEPGSFLFSGNQLVSTLVVVGVGALALGAVLSPSSPRPKRRKQASVGINSGALTTIGISVASSVAAALVLSYLRGQQATGTTS